MTEYNKGKKILVLGGTGAMGVYLVPELAAMGYAVDVVSLDDMKSDHPRVTYRQANAKDIDFLKSLLAKNYDAIVDFMIYQTREFSEKYERLLGNTGHYIYLSSYRVYADSAEPITENSARLLDVSDDKEFLATEDYALYKARGEDILRASRFDNYTIVRPAITYSKRRFQLVTLEANTLLYRAFNKRPVFLPEEAMGIQATMSWAGDVARMMARLVLNPRAQTETYTLATAEHHTWQEVADYYSEIIGLDYRTVDAETYLGFFDSSQGNGARYQLFYDRCFNRVVDNAKILSVTGLKQADLMPLKSGLARELSALPKDHTWDESLISKRMDMYLSNR